MAWVVWVLPLKLPIIRSFIAYLLWRGNRGAHRFDWSSLYLAILCLTLVIWPAAGRQSSTFLSFGAVGWILLVARTRVRGWRKTVSVLLGLSALGALMGLLGTVVGMIDVFAARMIHGARDASVLAGGIGQALVTTAVGLVVAIPALIAHRLLQRRSQSFLHEIEAARERFLSVDPGHAETKARAT